jgi:hypothetical protein
MSISDILKSPEQSYVAGKSCAIDTFRVYGKHIATSTAQCPYLAYNALMIWDEKRLSTEVTGILIAAVLKDPGYCAELLKRDPSAGIEQWRPELTEQIATSIALSIDALLSWKPDDRNAAMETLLKPLEASDELYTELSENADCCLNIGIKCSDEFLIKYAGVLVDGVKTDSLAVTKAMREWSDCMPKNSARRLAGYVIDSKKEAFTISDSRYADTYDVLMNSVFDPNSCLSLGTDLPDDRFALAEDILSSRIANSPNTFRHALKNWKTERSHKLQQKLIEIYNLPDDAFKYHNNFTERQKVHFWNFVSITSLENMVRLKAWEIDALGTASTLAESDGNFPKFKEGFLVNADRGTVGPWAKAIVDNFKKQSYGGDNYHKRDVIAA